MSGSFLLDQSLIASRTKYLLFIGGIRSKTSAPQETNLAKRFEGNALNFQATLLQRSRQGRPQVYVTIV